MEGCHQVIEQLWKRYLKVLCLIFGRTQLTLHVRQNCFVAIVSWTTNQDLEAARKEIAELTAVLAEKVCRSCVMLSGMNHLHASVDKLLPSLRT